MKKLLIAVAVSLLSIAAHAAPPHPPPEAPWVLIGLDIHMGAVTVRDTAIDADTVSVYGEGLPVYVTARACRDALRHAIQKYTGKSHLDGNDGRSACINWQTWAHSAR